MTIRRVWSGATGANNGTSWTDAYTKFSSADGPTQIDDEIWVASDHAESININETYAFKSDYDNYVYVYSIDRSDDSYLAGAAISYSGTQSISFNNSVIMSGMNFTAWQNIYGNSTDGDVSQQYTDCVLKSQNGGISFGANSIYGSPTIRLINTNLEVGGSSHQIKLVGTSIVDWYGGTFVSPGSPANGLFYYVIIFYSAIARLEGVDISAVTSHLNTMYNYPSRFQYSNCLLGSGVSLTNTIVPHPGTKITTIGCDDATGNTLHRTDHAAFGGGHVVSDIVYRAAGATDGSSNFSWKISTDTNAKDAMPFRTLVCEGNLDATGTKTLTFHIAHDSVTDLTDDDVAISVTYPESAVSTKATYVCTKNRYGNTPTAHPTASSTWANTFTNKNLQEVSVTVTVGRTGAFRAELVVYKPSYTLYVCPKVEIT